ncbi:hypothetical protein [Paenibacillus glacialis]|uniref:Uncharacterized protein n=1 Tax=Paenibacillus glacialis TaxID=494026 RepID=A0A168MJV5_9BACL|nr:hypothetical protein [Paenibacillus glacialis]OAB44765.1 hypothetical protein PGLA_04950 [Paenibacillus glacialis]
MTALKQSGKYEEIKQIHTDLWNELSSLDESESEKLLNRFLGQVKLLHIKKKSYQELRNTVRSPWLYVALMIGISLPIMIYMLFIWISLVVE